MESINILFIPVFINTFVLFTFLILSLFRTIQWLIDPTPTSSILVLHVRLKDLPNLFIKQCSQNHIREDKHHCLLITVIQIWALDNYVCMQIQVNNDSESSNPKDCKRRIYIQVKRLSR